MTETPFTNLRDLIADTAADLSNENPYWTAGCLADALIEKGIIATRTDATPVAWMYEGPMGEHHIQEHRDCAPKQLVSMGWTETPLFSHPPATDVAALVEALQEVISATCDYLPPDGISEQECLGRVIGATDNPKIIAALAPFTKGQNDDT